MAFTEEDLKNIADQLRCPSGEMGMEVANNMNVNNAPMIQTTIRHMDVADGEHILELGPGNGRHITDLLKERSNVLYTALDISEDMVATAAALVNSFKARFVHYDGTHIPLEESTFDKVFSVNTIYFWEKPDVLLGEIKSVLKPGGSLYLTFADGVFMKNNLPFTKYGFTFYSLTDVVTLLTQNGFQVITHVEDADNVSRNSNEVLMRPYFLVIAKSTN